MKMFFLLGMGRLLRQSLKHKSHLDHIYGTTSKDPKMTNVIALKLSPNSNWPKSPIDHVLISLPPSIPDYLDYIELATNFYKNSFLTLLSSTSVFAQHRGPIDETTLPDNHGPQRQAELKIQNHPNHAIIRLGGLWGTEHLNAKLIKERQIHPKNGNINLISSQTAARLLWSHLKRPTRGIFHFVEQWHPTKKEFYESILNNKSINKLNDSSGQGKVILNPRTRQVFNYDFSGLELKESLAQ